MTSLKSKLRAKKLTIGSWLTLSEPSIAEIMSKAGFDWIVIDMEHSAITIDRAQDLIRVIELCGVTPLVRVGRNDPLLIKRVMDAGAHGVIVPMINSAAEAEAAVAAVKYPPLGSRGVGLARAQGYGLKFENYKNWLQRESVVIVQIEHRDAAENIDGILGVNGVDGFIIGPYDLSASLGRPGDFSSKAFKAAIGKIMSSSSRHNPSPGFHVVSPDAGQILKKIKEGYKFLAFSFDALLLAAKCREEIGNIKQFRARL